MSNTGAFFLKGRDKAPELFHYTACGLDNIYLGNGFRLESNSYGEGVYIEQLDELHEAIARDLVAKPEKLTGKEIRFLRKRLDATQADLAQWLSSDVQSIGRYERGECESIPGPVDKLVRAIYRVFTMPKDQLEALVSLIEEEHKAASSDQPKEKVFSQGRNRKWQPERAVAA